MPEYVIYRAFGVTGSRSHKTITCDSIEDAEEAAWEWALDRLESWVEAPDTEGDQQ